MQSINIVAFSLLIAFGTLLTLAQESKKKEVEVAPAPTALLRAKKIFVTNGGGDDEFYNLFYSEMKSWGRYELVGSPEEADVAIEFSFGSQGEPPQVYTNPANLMTYSYTVNKAKLTVYDIKTHFAVWSTTEIAQGARRDKNVKKNRIKAALKVVENLKSRVGQE